MFSNLRSAENRSRFLLPDFVLLARLSGSGRICRPAGSTVVVVIGVVVHVVVVAVVAVNVDAMVRTER
jgi:hypothetical protein